MKSTRDQIRDLLARPRRSYRRRDRRRPAPEPGQHPPPPRGDARRGAGRRKHPAPRSRPPIVRLPPDRARRGDERALSAPREPHGAAHWRRCRMAGRQMLWRRSSTASPRTSPARTGRWSPALRWPSASPQTSEALKDEGIVDHWRKDDDGFHLMNTACPYRKAAEASDAPCHADHRVVELLRRRAGRAGEPHGRWPRDVRVRRARCAERRDRRSARRSAVEAARRAVGAREGNR